MLKAPSFLPKRHRFNFQSAKEPVVERALDSLVVEQLHLVPKMHKDVQKCRSSRGGRRSTSHAINALNWSTGAEEIHVTVS